MGSSSSPEGGAPRSGAVSGHLFDFDGRLHRVELHGECPVEAFDALVSCFGGGRVCLAFELLSEGVALDALGFFAYANRVVSDPAHASSARLRRPALSPDAPPVTIAAPCDWPCTRRCSALPGAAARSCGAARPKCCWPRTHGRRRTTSGARRPFRSFSDSNDWAARVRFRRGLSVGRSVQSLLRRLERRPAAAAGLAAGGAARFPVISAGYHTDDLSITQTCRALGFPTASCCKRPARISGSSRGSGRATGQRTRGRRGASSCRTRTAARRIESGARLVARRGRRQSVQRRRADPTWPGDGPPWKLACVARLHFQAKGRTCCCKCCGSPEWRSRPLEVVLWGHDGGNRRQIELLIELYGLQGAGQARRLRHGRRSHLAPTITPWCYRRDSRATRSR